MSIGNFSGGEVGQSRGLAILPSTAVAPWPVTGLPLPSFHNFSWFPNSFKMTQYYPRKLFNSIPEWKNIFLYCNVSRKTCFTLDLCFIYTVVKLCWLKINLQLSVYSFSTTRVHYNINQNECKMFFLKTQQHEKVSLVMFFHLCIEL